MDVQNRIFSDLVQISEIDFDCFFGRRGRISSFVFWAWFQDIFALVFESKPGRLGLPKQGFGKEGFAKMFFLPDWIFDDELFYARFSAALRIVFSGFCCPGDGDENQQIFSAAPDPKSPWWRRW